MCKGPEVEKKSWSIGAFILIKFLKIPNARNLIKNEKEAAFTLEDLST